MKKVLLKLDRENFTSIVFLSILVLIIPFVYTQATLDPALVPRHLALNILLLIYGVSCFYRLFKSSKYVYNGIFDRYLFKIYIAYLFVAAISIMFALNKSEAIYEWFKILTFFILFCLLTISLPNGKTNYIFLTRLIVIYSIVISLWGFYELFTISSLGKLDHQSSYFIRAFSSNRNLYSQILFLTLSFNLFGIYKFKAGWKVLSIISSIFVIVLVTILLTRSVWIAFIASLLLSVCILLIFHYYFSLNRKAIKIIVLAVVTGIVIIASGIFLYSKFGGTEVFKKQTYWISNYKYGSTLERVDIWKNTLIMSMDNPVTGVGQGNWRIKFPAYGLENLRSETGEIFFQRPHNDFLWVLAENGIVGLILYVMLFFMVYYYLFKLIKKSPHSEKKYLALAMIFGLTGYLMISLFSFPKERIEHQLYVHIIFAIALTEYNALNLPNQQLKKSRLTYVFWLFLGLMIVGSYLTLSRFISEKHIAKAYKYREQHNWQDEIEEYKLAGSFTTKVDAFSTPLAWYIGEAWFNLNELDSAHLYFRRAYEINPYHLHVLNNLGTTYELKGKSDKAESFFLKAHSIAPRFEDPLFNLCALYYNKSNFDLAYETIKKIDLHTVNPKYERFLKAILWYKVDEFNQTLSERVISKSVIRIRNSEDWMRKVHEQSIENETEFKKQLLLEAIYLLESVDSTITSNEAEGFRKKYNLQ